MTENLHFGIDPQFIVELARQRYWFEYNKKSGVDILRCFIGIEPYQITRILEGNATISPEQKYVEIQDRNFKKHLESFLKHARENAEENFTWLGGIRILRKPLDDYVTHVKERLRDSRTNSHYGIMFEQRDIDEILGMETTRQQLHELVLRSAGFERSDMDDDACEFKLALDSYVEQQCKDVLNESIKPLCSDEIARRRVESDKLVKYMDNLVKT